MSLDFEIDTTNILVTGAAGFIGSNFARMILKEHGRWEITALDSCTYAGNLSNLEHCFDDPMFEFIKGDICDAALIDCLLCDMDVVINFAAHTDVDRSIMSACEFIKTNVEGTAVLAEMALKHGIKKFIQISTDEVYGSKDDGSFTEDSPLRPTNPYSASKAAADLLLLAFFHTHGLPVVIIRSSDNYGPYQFPEKMIPLFITNLLEKKKLPIYGDGNQVRDWIHVDDHCRAIIKAIILGEPGNIYNVGSHNEFRNIEIAKTILQHLGQDESFLSFVEDRPGHDRRYGVNTAKANEKLEWKPIVDFGSGLREVVKWYAGNTDWWRKIKTGEYVSYYEKQYGDRLVKK